ncbi:hypothetical protein [Glaciibacter superstes]|uniref:hypothetical protein n=1 Tax=Glaciibacter superstes TaxID=501023 RepID=UPI0003B78945|nr:hypothetical protein [Glaciibacter superstes]
MALLDRIFGRNITLDTPGPPTNDEEAVERYEYLLRTAKSHTIEKAHVEAFEKLTSEQRDLVFERFIAEPPAGERPADASPATLAKTATRAESRQPGILTRVFGDNRVNTGNGTNGAHGDSFLGTFATYAIASTAIDAIFWAGLVGTTVVATNADSSGDSSSIDAGSGAADTDFFGGFDF